MCVSTAKKQNCQFCGVLKHMSCNYAVVNIYFFLVDISIIMDLSLLMESSFYSPLYIVLELEYSDAGKKHLVKLY